MLMEDNMVRCECGCARFKKTPVYMIEKSKTSYTFESVDSILECVECGKKIKL